LADGSSALNIPYTPTPVARQFIYDTRMITGFFGPLGTAKTTALCFKAWLYCQRFPGARVVIVRDTYPNLIGTTQRSFFQWFPPGLAGEYHKTEKTFVLRTRGASSEILFRALDDERDVRNVLSLEVAAAAIDEPQGGPNTKGGADPGIDENLYDALLARVGRQSGFPLKMLWMCGNPPSPSHWLAKEFEYEGAGEPRDDLPKKRLYLATQDENRANLHPTYYEDLIDLWGVDTPLARRFIFGEWVEFATEQPFHREWFEYWGGPGEPEPDPGTMLIEAGFDPAISKNDRAARSALVVAGQVRKGPNRGQIFVLHTEAGHWSVYEQVRRIIAAVREHGIQTVRIEDVAYQQALADVLERETRLAGVHVRVDPVPPDGDKLRRANAWSPLVENGTVMFGRQHMELIKAMLAVPGDATQWDLVDAAGLCIRGFPSMPAQSTRLVSADEVDGRARAASYAVRGHEDSRGPMVVRSQSPAAAFLREHMRTRSAGAGMQRAKGYAAGTWR
jgi:predicted phage terminase large subunit-like protein